MLRAGLSKKLDPTLDISPVTIFAQINEDPTLMIINCILIASEVRKLALCLHVGTC